MRCQRRAVWITLALLLAALLALGTPAEQLQPRSADVALAGGVHAAVPTISVRDETFPESGGPIGIAVRIDPPSAVDVWVQWATERTGVPWGASGGADCSADFIMASGFVTFSPGQAEAVIPFVTICHDTRMEADEAFLLRLSNPTGGAQLGRDTATITIANNDGTPTVTLEETDRGEQTTSPPTAVMHRFTVMVPPAFQGHATVDYATGSGTATAGSSCGQQGVDFIPSAGTVELHQYGGSFSVAICSDATFEPDETFTISLTNATPGMRVTTPVVTVSIRNDDPLPAPCAVRPQVQLQTSVLAPGRMQVTVRATTSPGTAVNPLSAITFTRLDNARIEVYGQAPSAQPFSVALTGQPTEVTFVVNRVAPGPVTVHLTVQDSCGSWPSFVGGGAAAF